MAAMLLVPTLLKSSGKMQNISLNKAFLSIFGRPFFPRNQLEGEVTPSHGNSTSLTHNQASSINKLSTHTITETFAEITRFGEIFCSERVLFIVYREIFILSKRAIYYSKEIYLWWPVGLTAGQVAFTKPEVVEVVRECVSISRSWKRQDGRLFRMNPAPECTYLS